MIKLGAAWYVLERLRRQAVTMREMVGHQQCVAKASGKCGRKRKGRSEMKRCREVSNLVVSCMPSLAVCLETNPGLHGCQ